MSTHDDEVAFVMGEVGARALNPLPQSRDVRPRALSHLDRAAADASPHDSIPGGRLGFLRRLLVRLLGTPLERQAHFNRDLVSAAREIEALTTIIEERLRVGWINLDHRLGVTQGDVTRLEHAQFDIAQSFGASVGAVDLRVTDAEGALADLESRLDADRERLAALAAELDLRHAEIAMLRARLDREHSHAVTGERPLAPQGVEGSPPESEALSALDEMYLAFEDRFRGSREQVKEWQRAYLDDVRSVGGSLPVFDIGPGRGEWLEMLREEGIDGYGVDLNPTVAERAGKYGVDVRVGDAVDHLASAGPNAFRAVTAFHVVEHLPVEAVIQLIDAALLALQPGGVLILETPNPSNVAVGACNFYLDPTHLRPMHPQLLEFLVDHRGFGNVDVRYLHAAREVDDPGADTVRAAMAWALFGPQDYAVVARKPPSI